MNSFLHPINLLDVLGVVAATPVEAPAPLRLTCVGASAQIGWQIPASSYNAVLEYRVNDGEWQAWDYSPIVLNHDDYAEFKGDNRSAVGGIGTFTMAGDDVEADGNLMSIVYGDALTYDNSLSFDSNYPGMTLEAIFTNCTNLTTPPHLAEHSLPQNAYKQAFSGCSSLMALPNLGTDLSYGCFEAMFAGCTSLYDIPAMYSDSFPERCCASMFQGCTAIESATIQLANTEITFVGVSAFTEMFSGCSALQDVDINFTQWPYNATYDWLQGVAATGIFRCPAELDTSIRDASHIPVGWTIETY